MIHACAIQYVKDQSVLNELIGCMMQDNKDIKSNAEKCAKSFSVDYLPIQACSETKEGGDLLAMHGDDTHSLKPGVQFIPTVQINGGQKEQSLMLKNLPKAICHVFEKSKESADISSKICDI